MYREIFERIVAALPAACQTVYGDRLKALALYGSVARCTMRPDSDVDLLLMAEPLPPDHPGRMREFAAAETMIEPVLAEAGRKGVRTFLSPVIKTPEELRQGSFLHLDRSIRLASSTTGTACCAAIWTAPQ